MRKLLLTLLALCCPMATWAQNELLTAMLHHEGETTLFIGPESFIEAEEASADGDVITLSSGDFKLLPVIKNRLLYMEPALKKTRPPAGKKPPLPEI